MSNDESDETRWKLLLLVPVYSLNHLRGLLLLLTTPCPQPFVSLITSLIFCILSQFKGLGMQPGAHLDSIVHLCNNISPFPSLPDWIKRTSRLIWKSVSSQNSCFFKANVTVFFSFPQIVFDLPTLSETEQYIWPFPLHLTPHSSSPDQVSTVVFNTDIGLSSKVMVFLN